jgi:hypothetical protein
VAATETGVTFTPIPPLRARWLLRKSIIAHLISHAMKNAFSVPAILLLRSADKSRPGQGFGELKVCASAL